MQRLSDTELISSLSGEENLLLLKDGELCRTLLSAASVFSIPRGWKSGASLSVNSSGVVALSEGQYDWRSGDARGAPFNSALVSLASLPNYPSVGSWAFVVGSRSGSIACAPATGALTGRPTDAVNIATTTGANFATLYNGGYYYRDPSGVYWRILGAIGRRASAGAATDFYVINLGHGSDESGKNDRGYWTRDGMGVQRNVSNEISLPGCAFANNMATQYFYTPAPCGTTPYAQSVEVVRGSDSGACVEVGQFWANGPYFDSGVDVTIMQLYTYKYSMTANYTRVRIRSEQNYTS